MRRTRSCLALLTLVTTACGVIRFGGGTVVRLGGSWTGALEVEGQEIVGVLTLSQRGRDLVLCSQSLFRFADLGDDGLCRGGPDKGCGVIVSAIDVVVDRLD